MSRKTASDQQLFNLWSRIALRLVSAIGCVVVWLVGRTVRFKVEGESELRALKEEGRAAILSFWHNQILLATFFFRFRDIVVITSRHFDGEYIARIIRRFGYGTARGSSTRGAVKALLQLKKHLQEGRDVAFTIDGPRGPAYKVKPGPIWLSLKTQSPVVCFHIEPRRFWALNSWDRFRIPLPFTEVAVRIGKPLYFREGVDSELAVREYQAEMDRLRCEAEAVFARS